MFLISSKSKSCLQEKFSIGKFFLIQVHTARMNVIHPSLVPYSLRQEISLTSVTDANGNSNNPHETSLSVFLTEDAGLNITPILHPNLDCALYLGTPFLDKTFPNGMECNQHQKKLDMFFHYQSWKFFFPFISIHSPNTLHRMEILKERVSELHTVSENMRISEQLLEPKNI